MGSRLRGNDSMGMRNAAQYPSDKKTPRERGFF